MPINRLYFLLFTTTMGFRSAAVLGPVCFFLGVLFICFNVDHRVLWGGLSDDVVEDGFQFYGTFFMAPPAIKGMLHGLVGVAIIGLIAKLHAWDDSAMFFDGSSLAAMIFALAVYLTVVVPTLRTIATPLAEDTRADRIEALTILSAGNVIIGGCMGLVLVLQAGQEYARRSDAREQARLVAEGTSAEDKGKTKKESKKKQ
ncbi:Shr3 amino acid permease chaperone [Mycena maculata]|uniref:Shr3 amino acid permease chaperone n=1 Tax=Mycena maculata TaxID=230809 RepID=A0AAD7IN47_9AGAR|nr:Shr3 amino acid permease chaperone [Mycena maculata]